MAFFRILKSKEERDFELKSQLRQANNKIEQHVRKLSIQCEKYKNLALRAFNLRDPDQFADLARRLHLAIATRNRWERYQLKLNSMELQRDEVRATEEFLSAIGGLTQTILRGVSPMEVQRIAKDIQQAEQKCQDLEQSMADHMVDLLEPATNGVGFEGILLEDFQTDAQPETMAEALRGNSRNEYEELPASRSSKLSFEEALRYYQN